MTTETPPSSFNDFSEVTTGLDSTNSGGNGGGSDHHPNMPITGHKLNGKNFLQCSQSVLIFLRGKGRDEYLTENIAKPAKDSAGFKKWMIDNNLMMPWLLNSMTNDISEKNLLCETTQEIWDVAKETFSTYDNTQELFAVESVLHDLRQGEETVTQYFTKLTRLWQQFDVFEKYKWKNPEDEITHKKSIEKKVSSWLESES